MAAVYKRIHRQQIDALVSLIILCMVSGWMVGAGLVLVIVVFVVVVIVAAPVHISIPAAHPPLISSEC